MKRILYILSLLLIVVMPARAGEPKVEDESVDVKGIIFEHLKDSYHWHILSTNNKEISLYLPVILHSKVSGWHFFMSSKLGHEGSYEGFRMETGHVFNYQVGNGLLFLR